MLERHNGRTRTSETVVSKIALGKRVPIAKDKHQENTRKNNLTLCKNPAMCAVRIATIYVTSFRRTS